MNNRDEIGPIEQRYLSDSIWRAGKKAQNPPFTASCARMMDVLSTVTVNELTLEKHGITKTNPHTTMTATVTTKSKPRERCLDRTDHPNERQIKRQQWRMKNEEKCMQSKRSRLSAEMFTSNSGVQAMLATVDSMELDESIVPDRERPEDCEYHKSATDKWNEEMHEALDKAKEYSASGDDERAILWAEHAAEMKERKRIYNEERAASLAAEEGDRSHGHGEPVSYTHLTLPTILRV